MGGYIKKTERVYIRCTKEQHDKLKELSCCNNMTVSEYMLSASLQDNFFYEKNSKTDIEEKTHDVKSYLSAKEYNYVVDQANLANMSMSKYIRSVLMGNEVIVYDGLKDFAIQLSRLGNNVNQLVKLAHMGKVSTVGVDEIQSYIKDIWNKLNGMVK